MSTHRHRFRTWWYDSANRWPDRLETIGQWLLLVLVIAGLVLGVLVVSLGR